MKSFFIVLIILSFIYKTGRAQEVKGYIKNLTANEFTLDEFKRETNIRLTDTTKKISSYMITIVPDSADITAIMISGSSLRISNLQNVLEQYRNRPIRLFFENITYWVGLENSPDGYKKAEMAVGVIKIN